MTPVDVVTIAQSKGLTPEVLHGFDVTDAPYGVRIAYRMLDGSAGRARMRTALRGVDGSSWEPDDLPVTAYWRPLVIEAARRHGVALIVEGESDCWTAWQAGFAAVGIPGGDHMDVLEPGHVDAAALVVVVEPDNPRTYPEGVDHYVGRIECRLRSIGYEGPVFRMQMDDVIDDVNALYRQDPDTFPDRLASRLAAITGGAAASR